MTRNPNPNYLVPLAVLTSCGSSTSSTGKNPANFTGNHSGGASSTQTEGGSSTGNLGGTTPSSIGGTSGTGTTTINFGADIAAIAKYTSRQEVIDVWPYGSPAIVRDQLGNHELLYLSLSGGQMVLYRSANLLASASAVTKSGPNSITSNGPTSMAQDSEGNLHLMHDDDGVAWSKITLTRTSGSVTSWSLSAPIKLPGDYGVSDYRLECRSGMAGTEESIFFMVTSASSNQACQAIMFRSKINPASTADFTKLSDGKAGYDVLYTTLTISDSPHGYGGHFAQVGSSGDILSAFGPINVGHGGYEQHHSYTRFLKSNGIGIWSIGELIDRGSNNGISRQLLYGAYGNGSAAWIMWQDPDHGVRFDSYSSTGTYTARAVPEPDATINYNGVGTFSVSPSGHIYASYLLYDNGMNAKGVYWAYYNGSVWNKMFDFTQADFQGMHGSVGWDTGLASIYVPDPPSTQYIGAIYTAP